MAKIAVIKSGTNDEWKVFTKKDGTFHKALLNDERMIEKENKKDGEKIDLNSVEDDFDAFPNIEGGNVKEGNTYAYSLPIRNRQGVIIKWVCGGTGPYACGG